MERGKKYFHSRSPKTDITPFFIRLARSHAAELDYLVELAEYFDVSCDYLLGRTDIKK